jgi:DNA-binding response OmpR family regulator
MLDPVSATREQWTAALKAHGFTLDLFKYIADGDEALKQMRYEALFMNSRLSDADPLEWLRMRRSTDQDTKIIFVTRQQEVETRIKAFESGADDCVTDMIDPRELVAKLRALLRRGPIMRANVVEAGNLKIDTAAREATIDGKALVIPRREFSMLEHFVLSFNRTLTREYLELTFYGASSEVCPNSIEVRISRLRRTLLQAGANVEIKTIRGIGYKMQYCQQDMNAALVQNNRASAA